MTVIIFLIVLAVLIFVHELGHFIAARACGIRVDAFKIGFGPKIFAWKKGETEYGLNLIPFGGYVKIHGENPDEESVSGPDAARSFVNKKRWQQVIVLAAGVFFNFVFAWILYAGVFATGVTATQEGFEKYADRFENERIMVTYVSPDSPAEKAGIKTGDTLTRISLTSTTTTALITASIGSDDGSLTVASVQGFIDMSKGKMVTFNIERKDEAVAVQVSPVEGLVEGKYAVGIAMQEAGDLRLPFFTAVWESLRYTLMMIRGTAEGLGVFFLNIFQGDANFSDVAGPVGIAGIVGDAAGLGFTYLLMITALISINLGVINLVPFPALDGGRILFVLIEGVIRRRIPMKFSNALNIVGFGLLMLLMVVVTFKDIVKLIK